MTDEFPAAGSPVDIGSGVTITFVEYNNVIVGLNEAHKDKDGNVCMGFVAFAGEALAEGRPQWRVERKNPLTLSPSILCRTCGNHGYIRDGRWVPA